MIRKKIIEAVTGRYYEKNLDSRVTNDEGSKSKPRAYKAGIIEKKTYIIRGEKDDFIYNYNVKLHGGRRNKSEDVTFPEDSEWVEKV